MSRYFAFLRAINVGGHTVKMDQLRNLFENIGLTKVETYIASGNVIFETRSGNVKVLEKQIQTKLLDALGYEVATFIRTDAELEGIASYKPFKQSIINGATALNIAFLSDKLDEKSKQNLMKLRTDIDDFHVNGREIYWMCLKKQSESTFSNAVLEKALGIQSTLRGVNTIRKLAEKYIK